MAIYNLLSDSLFRARLADGRAASLSLPAVLAALGRNAATDDDAVEGFAGVRPHQRPVWHAFLVQLAAIALHRAGRTAPVDGADTDDWAAWLRALTPQWPDDAPWCLVAPAGVPAFLQPPMPSGDLAELKGTIETPDALDMLVTAKNHDVKSAVMARPEPDDWVYALISLQTQEGYLGAGKYGVARMNGGFSNRTFVGLAPPGGPGARFRRDVRALLRQRDEILRAVPFMTGDVALTWLEPWSGTDSLGPDRLDPFFIEVCRRVRLVRDGDRIVAREAGTKAPRIDAGALKGLTGDPWAPIDQRDAEPKSVSVQARGFPYGVMSELMFKPASFHPAPLQRVQDDDADEGLTLVAAGIARGQGKTEGYHERHIPLSREVRDRLRRRKTDGLAKLAEDRVRRIGDVRLILRNALFVLIQEGKSDADLVRDHKASAAQAEPWLARFERAMDRRFFDDLWDEVTAEDAGQDDADKVFDDWLVDVAEAARAVLTEAGMALPSASMRRLKARAQADAVFGGRRHRFLQEHRRRQHDDRAA